MGKKDTHQDPTDPAPFSDEELDELATLQPASVAARHAFPRLLSGYRALREENERLRANQSLDAAPELQRFPFRALAKTEPEDIDKLVTVCRMNAMASGPHVALTHLTIAGTLLALRDEVEKLRAESEELRNRLLEEHEGNPGRVEAKRWEECAIDKETEAFLAKERLKEARDENERLRAMVQSAINASEAK